MAFTPSAVPTRGVPRSRFTRVPILVLGLLLALLAWPAAPALAFTNSNHVSFTLEGCRNNGGITLPIGGKFICPDAAYTTGNLGKGWNELDLVPHRLTTQAGTQTDATTDYDVIIAADNQTGTATGYDVITVPALNAAKSDASCTVSAGAQSVAGAVTGGADVVIYRTLTIHQEKGTTCVFDWVERLALGAHLYSGSSLQSYMFEQDDFKTGKRTLSIPVNEILPQELHKDMTASQVVDFAWNITKSATPAVVNFGDTCSPAAELQKPVSLTIGWQRLEGTGGAITVITNIYATNPASRTIAANVTDQIRSGTSVLDTASSGPVNVPANTTNFLVLTHMATVAAGTTDLNDIATATYTDLVTGVPVPGQTTATASAPVQVSDLTNETATVTDVESISGTGLDFRVDSIGGTATWTCDTGVPSPFTTGPYSCISDTQSGAGSATFNKTVRLDQPRITSGVLSDTATLTAADNFTATSSASITVQSSAKVRLTITKNMPDVLQGNETATFTFQISGPTSASASITFGAGETSKSVTVGNLDPGTYSVTETPAQFFIAVPPNPKSVTIDLPACAGEVTFDNVLAAGPAHVQVSKVTFPAGLEAGWTFDLNPGPLATVTTDSAAFKDFPLDLAEGSFSISETLLSGFEFVDSLGDCNFTVNYPADTGRTFQCTYRNRGVGAVTVHKTINGLVDPTKDFSFALTGPGLQPSGTTVNESLSTLGDLDGTLVFLSKLQASSQSQSQSFTYTMCEATLPAGWASSWTLNGAPVTPYNPDAPLDNGVRCFDFTVAPGATAQFSVDNTHPGGAPRTIGYWRNWNTCASSNGKQVQTAAANGGAAAGFFLVDDLLPRLIGNFNITTCAQAVKVLSKQDQSGNNKASDAAYGLAAQLLGAKLNVGAGAGTCTAANTAIASAQALLVSINFTGSGSYLGPKGPLSAALRNQALSLAATLDQYNNGLLCP